jgi:hypothetical protein
MVEQVPLLPEDSPQAFDVDGFVVSMTLLVGGIALTLCVIAGVAGVHRLKRKARRLANLLLRRRGGRRRRRREHLTYRLYEHAPQDDGSRHRRRRRRKSQGRTTTAA